MHNVRTTASATKKHGVSKLTVSTPENLEALRNGVDQSPRWSAVRHAQALRLSDTTVRRILHQDLNFHPYKVMIVQETSWLHRASNNVETFLLPTDAHNVKKHRVIKTF